MNKIIVIAFLGNAYHDSRVVNLIDSLKQENFQVKTISFDWKTKDLKTQLGETSIYKLDKSSTSISFYFNFFFLLIKNLLKHKAQIYFAEDIYTLPIVYFFAKLNKAKVFYNSREIYAHLAGLRNKGLVQSIIARVERSFIYKVDSVLVTGQMDAEYLEEAYGIKNLVVIRNLPKYTNEIKSVDLRTKLSISKEEKIILYQGVVLEGRGILYLIKLLDKINNAHFVIVGDGEFRKEFEKYANESTVKNRVHFIGAVKHEELINYTSNADIGISLIENISISYYYALPNKLFEYIMAGVPILSSKLPQMEKVVSEYKVGQCVDMTNEDEVVQTLNEMLSNDEMLNEYSANCKKAAKELNWEAEFEKIKYLLTMLYT
ncbi:MAG: glycosyltransferase family 4 protein [Ignavibacteriae bacterium]|nr:glycosyltransferase family 4 protein [Ignavibacteriota bacterium]